MAGPGVPYEVRARFFELMCGGWSLSASAGAVGVAKQSAWEWWHDFGPMTLRVVGGRVGGLSGTPPSPVPDGSEESGREAPRRRRRPLTSEDRAVIAACLQRRGGTGEKMTLTQIGELIDRKKSVISREITRNSGPDGSYYGALADRAAHEQRRRPKPFRLLENPELCRRIEAWMDQGWSPKLVTEADRACPG